jgi:hypothetical protein
MSIAAKSAWVSVAAIALSAVLPVAAVSAQPRDRATSWSAARATRGTPPRCAADQLRVRTRATGSDMSQPYARIAVRNVGPRACTVGGYPRIVARGARAGRHNVHRLAIRVRRGSFMEAHDHGAHRVGLRPGGTAVFGLGTATAYGRRVVTIQTVKVTLPRIDGAFVVALGIDASAPRGKRIPVFLTALARHVR